MDDIGTYSSPTDRFSSPITVIGNLISSFRERATRHGEKKVSFGSIFGLVEDINCNIHRDFVTEFTGNNGLEVPSKPTEARPPYVDETSVKTKQQVSSATCISGLA